MSKQTTATLLVVVIGVFALLLGAFVVSRSMFRIMPYNAIAMITVRSTERLSEGTIGQFEKETIAYKDAAVAQIESEDILVKALANPKLGDFYSDRSDARRIELLREQVTVRNLKGGTMITIEGEGDTPSEAADIANAVAEAFVAASRVNPNPKIHIALARIIHGR